MDCGAARSLSALPVCTCCPLRFFRVGGRALDNKVEADLHVRRRPQGFKSCNPLTARRFVSLIRAAWPSRLLPATPACFSPARTLALLRRISCRARVGTPWRPRGGEGKRAIVSWKADDNRDLPSAQTAHLCAYSTPCAFVRVTQACAQPYDTACVSRLSLLIRLYCTARQEKCKRVENAS
eukprot:IDg19923t1